MPCKLAIPIALRLLGGELLVVVRFAYEPRCSATRVDCWELGWEGCMCFADPAVPSGLVSGGDEAVRVSMRRLVERTPRAVWSSWYRLFYEEGVRGGYWPVREISEAIFNGVGRRMDCKDPNVPMELARRGAIAWRKLPSDMGWWPAPPDMIETSVVC
ncbi:uncharacterized protein B0H64DRAFT_435331 [Chaetomium fimeti]|uniref:Uncharacterized protein n=1 Tax=Chaetomium fimeti TaxID=1854472 RepID=A0AAE0HA59_9PEZI|nr:hypothetical protein B0H64DRAFT_435331 [Chaetomium fimeti]